MIDLVVGLMLTVGWPMLSHSCTYLDAKSTMSALMNHSRQRERSHWIALVEVPLPGSEPSDQHHQPSIAAGV
jgi:hypothetical protein